MKQSPVSVDAGGRQALSRKVGSKEVCILLGLHKDQSPLLGVALRVLHQFLQLGAFVKLGNLVEILSKCTLIFSACGKSQCSKILGRISNPSQQEN